MKIRRIAALLLALCMVFALVACGKQQPTAVKSQFKFTVIDADGKETSFDISTDKKTVGEALLEQKLIEGENSQYGLYVKTVNGITADYDKDGVYWAFYINGGYASTGVDQIDVVDGATYTFKIEK